MLPLESLISKSGPSIPVIQDRPGVNARTQSSHVFGWLCCFLLLLAGGVQLSCAPTGPTNLAAVMMSLGCAIALIHKPAPHFYWVQVIVAVLLSGTLILLTSQIQLELRAGQIALSAQLLILALAIVLSGVFGLRKPSPPLLVVLQIVMTLIFLMAMLPALAFDWDAAAQLPRAWIFGLCFLQLIHPFRHAVELSPLRRTLFYGCLTAGILEIGKYLIR